MAAIFPGAVATQLQLLTALNNTKVTLDVSAGIGDTTITVDDTSALPASGYMTFADDEDSPETISYTGKTATTLTGVTRGADGTAAATHTAGAFLEQRWNADYHNILTLEMRAVEQYLSDRFGITSHIVVPAGVNVTFQKTTNQLVLGTTRTVTITAPTPASTSRTWTIPDITADGTFAALEGTQTFSGTKTFSAAITISATTNQFVLGTTNTTTITSPAPAASRVYTIPDAGGAADFLLTVGAQTITGAKTFASSALLLQEAGSTDVVTIAVATLATGRTYTVPDAGGSADFVMTAGTQSIGGTKTFTSNMALTTASAPTLTLTDSGDSTVVVLVADSGGLAQVGTTSNNGFRVIANNITAIDISVGNGSAASLRGTNTNDSASAGFVGQYVESVASQTNATTSNQYGDLTSISLTAGDWDVSANCYWENNGATWTVGVIGISVTSGNSGTGLTDGSNKINTQWASSSTTPVAAPQAVVSYRLSLSATTTVYFKYLAVFSAGTPNCRGRLSARRVR